MLGSYKGLRKLLSTVLVLALLMSLLPAGVSATSVITVDGNASDWNGITPFLTGTSSVQSLSVYNDAEKLYLLVQGTSLNMSGEFYINTDGFYSTGYNPEDWPTCGADYKIQNNTLFKYTGAGNSESWLNMGTVSFSRNSTVVEASVDLTALAMNPGATIGVGYIRNDSYTQRLPQGYGEFEWLQLFPDNHAITVDGNGGDWASISTLDVGRSTIQDIKGTLYQNTLYLKVSGTGLSTKSQFFIDTDANIGTGYKPTGWSEIGAEYLLENNGLYHYSGTNNSWSWTAVGTMSYIKNDTTIEAAIPLGSLNNVADDDALIIGFVKNDSLSERIPACDTAFPLTATLDTPPAASAGNWNSIRDYLCNYAGDASIDVNLWASYDALILEPKVVSTAKLRQIRSVNPASFFIGYFSLGETAPMLLDANGQPLDIYFIDPATNLPRKNPNWNSYYVDCSKQAWHNYVLNVALPQIFAKGYDGVFLDTMDTSAYVDSTLGIDFTASAAGMANLVREMKQMYPSKKIITNRGFHLLNGGANDICASIDGDMFESYSTTWSSGLKNPDGTDMEWYHAYPSDSGERIWTNDITEQLNAKRFRYNTDGTVMRDAGGEPVKSSTFFHVFSLDYALADQTSIMQDCVNRCYASAFLPSVGMKRLDLAPAYDWKTLVSIPVNSSWGNGLNFDSMPAPNPNIDTFDSGVGHWTPIRGNTGTTNPDAVSLTADNGAARIDMTVRGTTPWVNATIIKSKSWYNPINLSTCPVTMDFKVSSDLTAANKSLQIIIYDYNKDYKAWTYTPTTSWSTFTLYPGTDGTYYDGWDGAKDGFQADRIKSIMIQVVNNLGNSADYTGSLWVDNLLIPQPPVSKTITVDGNFSDWSDVSVLANDPQDNGGANNDVKALTVTSKDGVLYVKLDVYGTFSMSVNNILYIDADNNGSTGFNAGSWTNFGAEYRVVFNSTSNPPRLHRFTGTSQGEDTWTDAGALTGAYSSGSAEIAIPYGAFNPALAAAQTIKLLYRADNDAAPDFWSIKPTYVLY